jgi:hypothetical protein
VSGTVWPRNWPETIPATLPLPLVSCDLIAPTDIASHCLKLLSQIANCEVANRPGRLEPRVIKRRRHGYKLMQQPRAVLKARLQIANSKM